MKRLLVEGTDDQHVLWSLFKRRHVAQTFEVVETKGYDKLIARLPVELKGSNLDALGVVVDADISTQARWDAVRAAFQKGGFTAVPANPVQGGLVVTEGDLRFGIWVMPDNTIPGMLEDFVSFLVPEDDIVWPISDQFVEGLPPSENRFRDVHKTKAKVHAWLAVQDSPGSPMGQAITKRTLNDSGNVCDDFVDWIGRLFTAQ